MFESCRGHRRRWGSPSRDSDASALAYETVYYWRVVAISSSGTTEGPVWTFTTESEPPPGTPALVSPANGFLTNSTSVTLNWSSVSGATSYRAHRGTTSDFSSATQVYSGGSTQVTLNGLSDGTYYWWAESRNAGVSAGSVGPLGGSRTFTVDTVPPSLTITDQPESIIYNATAVRYTFSASEHTVLRCRKIE